MTAGGLGPADIFALARSDDPDALMAALTGPPSELRDANGVSLPLLCLYERHDRCLATLVERFGEGLTIHEAAAIGLADRLRACLAAASWAVNLLSADGWTPLHLAAHFGRLEAIRILLAHGADANLFGRGFERNLPLHAACAGRPEKLETVRMLIPVTANLDAIQGEDWTAAKLAQANGFGAIVAMLVEAGATAPPS